jgi:hypothetical protein
MPCMGRPARPPPPPSVSPHLNLRGLVFNFKFKVSVALSFFLLRIFFSRTKSFIDIDDFGKNKLETDKVGKMAIEEMTVDHVTVRTVCVHLKAQY